MKIRYLILPLLFFISHLYGYDFLQIEDPQRPWRDGQGTIEEAIISVRPQGLYMEYGLYLTFSGRGLGFTNADQMEVQFFFDLPEGAIVHDSWLWVGEDIIRGELLDKWTAGAIYDTIVNRNQDPSILWKRSQTQYELRIFPMAGDESRKVKISYLVPANWGADNVWSELPTNLLRTSKHPVNTLHCLTWLNEPTSGHPPWENPTLLEFPGIEFEPRSDNEFGNYYRADIPPSATNGPLHFSLNAPYNGGVYLNKLEGSENFYQMALLPSKAFSLTPRKKVAICIDNRIIKTQVNRTELLSTTKNLLKESLSEVDSFNIFASAPAVYQASPDWVTGSDIDIESIFNNIPTEIPTSYSNIPALLFTAINFIKTHGDDASIMLISSTDGVGDFQTANQLVTNLLAAMNMTIPIHVVDFMTQNYNRYSIGGRWYYGNEYFYTNISRQTGGEFNRMLFTSSSFQSTLSIGLDALNGYINTLDLYTTLENGFCYARQSPIQVGGTAAYYNRPIVQIGKYSGSFPFKIEAAGFFENQPFNEQFAIPGSDIYQADTLSREIWEGNFIQQLEKQPQTNATIAEILDHSLNERILSLYSAFLCLDPARGGEICYDCKDESGLVGIGNDEISQLDSLKIEASPNPFNSQTRIKVVFNKPVSESDVSFRIFNVLGQVVRSFDSRDTNDRRTWQFNWNGRSDNGTKVATGQYFFVLTSPGIKRTMKLLLVN